MTFDVRSRARAEQELLIDVAVHFVKASGKPSRKVFKLKRVRLAPRHHIELRMTVSLAIHTTRKPQPGKHNVDVIVNGTVFPVGAFDVTRAKVPKR